MSNSIFAWVSICGFVLFILAILTAFGVGVYFLLRNAKRFTTVFQQSWEEFARAKGLTFETFPGSAYPKVSGTYRNRPITLLIYHHSRRTWFTQVTTPVKTSPDLRLEIAPRSSLDWMITGPDIEFGSEQFRTKYRAMGTIPTSALANLNSAVQSALLETEFSLLRLDKGTLTLLALGFETRPQVLEALLDLACLVAETFEQ